MTGDRARATADPVPFWLDAADVTAADSQAVIGGAAVSRSPVAVLEVAGAGAVTCLQGLLTNDLVAPGDNAFLYGALLTAKGMIVTDMWVSRAGESVFLYVPERGKDPALTAFARTLPPRLARLSDRSDDVVVIRLVGSGALAAASQAGIAFGEPGTLTRHRDLLVGRPPAKGPFALHIHGARESHDETVSLLTAAGAVQTTEHALELARVLAGWPRLGAEIDDKTLPQEVRFDAIHGVSHTKGCYLGQETVARVHFRGHVNKRILGLRFASVPDAARAEITFEGRRVGRVTSVAYVASLDASLGLGMIRREVEPDAQVMTGDIAARTADLPFALP